MKRSILRSSLLSGIMALLFALPVFNVWRTGTLTEITNPYLGEYECVRAELDGQDMLKEYTFIRLELKMDNEFTLTFKDKEGEMRQEKGEYQYDEKMQTITMRLDSFRFIKRKFPLTKGVLTIEMPIGGKNAVLQFEQS